MRGALLRYRIMAWITGVLLIVLCFIGLPLKYLADSPAVVAIVGTAHGFVYIFYLVATADLTVLRARWPIVRVLLIALAGTIPLLSFVAERYVSRTLVAEGQLNADPSPAG